MTVKASILVLLLVAPLIVQAEPPVTFKSTLEGLSISASGGGGSWSYYYFNASQTATKGKNGSANVWLNGHYCVELPPMTSAVRIVRCADFSGNASEKLMEDSSKSVSISIADITSLPGFWASAYECGYDSYFGYYIYCTSVPPPHPFRIEAVARPAAGFTSENSFNSRQENTNPDGYRWVRRTVGDSSNKPATMQGVMGDLNFDSPIFTYGGASININRNMTHELTRMPK